MPAITLTPHYQSVQPDTPGQHALEITAQAGEGWGPDANIFVHDHYGTGDRFARVTTLRDWRELPTEPPTQFGLPYRTSTARIMCDSMIQLLESIDLIRMDTRDLIEQVHSSQALEAQGPISVQYP